MLKYTTLVSEEVIPKKLETGENCDQRILNVKTKKQTTEKQLKGALEYRNISYRNKEKILRNIVKNKENIDELFNKQFPT